MKLAVVFPGQGSQSVGMLANLATTYSSIIDTFTQASDLLGYDLWQLCQQGPQAQLDQTVYTQPALLCAGYAVWQVLQTQTQLNPCYLAGHSLGEYTALLAASALSFKDALTLVRARGEYMQAAVGQDVGAMAAIIGLEADEVDKICQALATSDNYVAAANYNSLGQVVIAGHKEAVTQAMQQTKAAGAKLVKLIPVSVPSHCVLMTPAAEKLKVILDQTNISTPTFPVISNVTAQPYANVDAIRQGLVAQLIKPVRWVETIQFCIDEGVTQIIECGPGKVLTGLIKRISAAVRIMTSEEPEQLDQIVHELNEVKHA